jgi:uncharacterized caspase-like protein
MKLVHAVLGLAVAWVWSSAYAQPDSLYPRINDPFAAATWRMDVDKAETVVAVGLANNSIALRSLQHADAPTMHFLPMGEEESQRAHPVAISPNGSTLAYGVPPNRDRYGWSVPNTGKVYIVDRFSDRVTSVISGLPSRAQDIRFSPDGNFLAAVFSSGCGLRVWRASDWKEYGRDDAGHAGDSLPASACTDTPGSERAQLPDTHNLAFTAGPQVWLVTSGMTGVRSYFNTGSSVERIKHRSPKELGLQVPDGIAASPDGTKVVIGDRRVRTVNDPVRLQVVVVAVDELTPEGPPLAVRDQDLDFPERLNASTQSDAIQFNLAKVAWVRAGDQEWVVGAGAFPCIAARAALRYGPQRQGPGELCAIAWPFKGSGSPRFLPAGTDQVVDATALRSKEALVLLSNRGLIAQRLDGQPLKLGTSASGQDVEFSFEGTSADFRDRPTDGGRGLAFLVSDDASYVYFEDYRRVQDASIRLGFDLKSLSLQFRPDSPGGLRAARVDPIVTGSPNRWINEPTPPLFGNAAIGQLATYRDIYRALTLLPERKVAIASANFIHIVGTVNGNNAVLCSLRIQSEGFRINASKDGRILVVAHGDGVLRWYRLNEFTGAACVIENLLSVHIRQVDHGKGWSWVGWLPDTGEFASDGHGRNLLSWQIPHEKCDTQTVGFGALTPELYDSDAVQKSLTRSTTRGATAMRLRAKLERFCEPAVLTVIFPKQRARVRSELVEFEVAVADTRLPQGIVVTLGSEERLLKDDGVRQYPPDEAMPISATGNAIVKVLLPTAKLRPNSEFHVCFYLGVARQCHPLTWDGGPPPAKKRRLWLVAVGVSRYGLPNEIGDLRYAQNDALDLAKIFLSDFRRQHSSDNPAALVDYESVSVEMFVSPPPNSPMMQELTALSKDKLVTLRATTHSEVMQAIDRVAASAGHDPAYEDVFVFFFSGHGTASPLGRVKGSSAFLLPADQSGGQFAAVPLSSGDLLERISKINAHTLLIFDACRTIRPDPKALPFDAAKVRSEFEDSLTSAYMIFSATPGEPSVESSEFAFDPQRNLSLKGNGVFSYALLKSLTSDDADSRSVSRFLGQITIEESIDYIKDIFIENRKSSILFNQQPIHVPWRSGTTLVLRTLH